MDLIEEKSCKAFCYSGRVVLSIKDYSDKQSAELGRVEKLKGNNYWVIDHRKKGEFLIDNNISLIPGIGKKFEEKLKAERIYTVQALTGLFDDTIQVLAAKPETKVLIAMHVPFFVLKHLRFQKQSYLSPLSQLVFCNTMNEGIQLPALQ
jgi:hypothetical protein